MHFRLKSRLTKVTGYSAVTGLLCENENNSDPEVEQLISVISKENKTVFVIGD